MSRPDTPIRPMARLYLFLLRAGGLQAILFLPLAGLALAMGYGRFPEIPTSGLALVLPGIVVSLVLACTPDRPSFLIRPTQFLKAFFVCAFFLNLMWLAITFELVMLAVAIDIPRLFTDLGLTMLLDWAAQVLAYFERLDPTLKAGAGRIADASAVLLILLPTMVIAQIAGIVVWFARFPATVQTETQRAYVETLARIETDKKDEALALLRERLARSSTV